MSGDQGSHGASHGAAHFQRLYDADPDPWQFRTSDYEQAKYRNTIATLGGQRFRSGFEVGCSVGVLTRLLAPQCETLLAVDIIDQPLAAARLACADQPWVRFQRMQVPHEWPSGTFDLILLSEVLYFLSPLDIAAVGDRVMHSLASDGRVLLVNWRGHADDPCSGDEASRIFIERVRPLLRLRQQQHNDRYRLDLLAPSSAGRHPGSRASSDPISTTGRSFAMTGSHGPLQGVKVVACSTAQAGTVPYMLMADLGAEVIKIEVPDGGDNSRNSTVMPGFPSTYFETNNRGVKSVTLNLKTTEGREILRKLVATADMFGQNFRPGAAEKNGFGYEELRTINPRLVYISISGYGPKGPHADLPGTDSMAQALGGIAEAYSTPGQPLRTGIVSVADETCAILAFGGALAALTYARTTGIGQKVDCSLLGGQIRLMGWTLTTTMWRDSNPVTGQARVTGTPARPGLSASFNDRDGKPLVFQLNGGRPWRAAMTALGFYETLEKAGFADLGVIIGSDERRISLLRLLDDLFATGLRHDWVAALRGADIVAAPINTLLEASSDPDVLANGYVTEVDYPAHGKRLKVHGSPWHFSETPAVIGTAPGLGADNDAVLAGLGYSAAEIQALRDRKVI